MTRFCTLVAILALSLSASAQPTSHEVPPTGEVRDLDVAASLGVRKAGAAAEARASYRLGPVDLLVDIGVARGLVYPRGMPLDDVTTFDASGGVRWTPVSDGLAALELSALAGVRRIGGADPVLAAAFELDASAVIRPRAGLQLRAGLAVPVAITEDGEVDQLDQRLHAGIELEIATATHLTAEVYGGGGYGYDGDGAKVDVGAMVGVRFAERGGVATKRSAPAAFVAMEYRALGVAGHTSHGLGYAVGATVLGGYLRVGIAGWNRPGPMNATTFATRPVDGQMHAGKSELQLRSDGNFVGLHVAPTLRLGKVSIMAPITFGQAAFGFYLHGSDRDAVMGERVSAVENRLFAGKDSSFALAGEVGLAASLELATWVSAFASVHYLATIGYAALDRDNYSGPSAAIGVAFTP
jgi:hypothetical protein